MSEVVHAVASKVRNAVLGKISQAGYVVFSEMASSVMLRCVIIEVDGLDGKDFQKISSTCLQAEVKGLIIKFNSQAYCQWIQVFLTTDDRFCQL